MQRLMLLSHLPACLPACLSDRGVADYVLVAMQMGPRLSISEKNLERAGLERIGS
jgi:hypothetical protein